MGNNSKGKYKRYFEKPSSCPKEISVAGSVGKELNSLSRGKNLWNVEWRGYIFSIRPFLCSALSFMHYDDIGSIVSSLVSMDDEDFYHNFTKVTREEYYSMYSEDENAVFSSILYQLDSYVPAIARYLLGVSNPKVVNKIFMALLKELSTVKTSDDLYVDFNDKSICNTEAFSYYLVYHWLFQKSQRLRLSYLKEIRLLDLDNTLDKLCPESSVHFKFISGQITAQELKDAYLSGGNGVQPVRYTELVNLTGRDDFDSSLHSRFLDKYLSHIKFNYEYEDFYAFMCNSYFTMGYYKKDSDIALFNVNVISDLEGSVEGYRRENRDLKSQIRSLNKSVISLKSDVFKLESECDHDKDIHISDLLNEISNLKSQIADLESSLDCKCNEISEYKHSIRSKIKEIKSLSARVNELESIGDRDSVTSSDISFENGVSLETMVESLKGYKIGIFGGFGIGDLGKILGDYGLTVKHFTGETNFVLGDLDCAVVLATSAKHKVYRRLKSQHNGLLIHINNLRIETIIEECYKGLCERREVIVKN